MKIKSHLLLDELYRKQIALLDVTRKKFLLLSEEELNWKHNPAKWSIAECLEHLNLYGDHYLPELAKAIAQASPARPDNLFQSSWLGNYFADLMLVKNGKVKKMKTFKAKNPIYSATPSAVLSRFIKQQETYAELIQQARGVDLQKKEVPTSLSRWIRLSVGDTLRLTVYHNQRHVWQANRMLARVTKLVLSCH